MKEQKFLTLALVGAPNAGKSTLTNYLVGEKLSIVTPKEGTTRSLITGIITKENYQFVIYDTPGIFKARSKMEQAMVAAAWGALEHVDIIALILDSVKEIPKEIINLTKRLSLWPEKIIILHNKIDLKSAKIHPITIQDKQVPHFLISALKGKGLKKLWQFLEEKAVTQPWLHDVDSLTDLPSRFLAEEITREQLFFQLNQELPYHLKVKTEDWQEDADSITIRQQIIINKQAHKPIIIGKGGQVLKTIGSNARANLSRFFAKKIHLFLFVKVKENWLEEDFQEIVR